MNTARNFMPYLLYLLSGLLLMRVYWGLKTGVMGLSQRWPLTKPMMVEKKESSSEYWAAFTYNIVCAVVIALCGILIQIGYIK